MSALERLLYRSETGDRWSLVQDREGGPFLVRHRPNEPSGGQMRDVDLATFLCTPGDSPERMALLDMLHDLIADDVEPGLGADPADGAVPSPSSTSEPAPPVRPEAPEPSLDAAEALARDVAHALRELEMLFNTIARHLKGGNALAASTEARADLLRASRELGGVGQRIADRLAARRGPL